jgi:hypothetical protein
MISPKNLFFSLIASLTFAISAANSAQKPPTISELGNTDKRYMTEQRDSLDQLARNHLGGQFNGNKASDLRLLQRLLDNELVRPDQTRELQAMGVIMGDLLAADLDMHWVVYEDSVGRSRALRYRESDNYLFPMTMISRRREVDNLNSVTDIYQKTYDSMEPLRNPLPFQ